MFLLMSKNISLKIAYREKTYRDDMVQSAYLKCLQKAHMFDLSKINPFAYFQSIIENQFKDIIFKTERERIYKMQMQNKTQNGISKLFNADAYEGVYTRDILEDTQHIASETNVWSKTFLGFLTEPGKSDHEKLLTYFIGTRADELIKTDGNTIVYFNMDCDNINGHCICEKCANKEFENRIGKMLMDFRQELLDNKEMD